MADKKISALTSATTPLAGTEVLPIVQSGSTVKVAVSNLTAGRAVSTGVLTSSASSNRSAITSTSNGANATLTTSGKTTTGTNVGFEVGVNIAADNTYEVYDTVNSAITLRYLNGNSGYWWFFGNGNARFKIENDTGNVTANVGNFVVGTAGKGIDFSANGGDVLSQYDEGNWTPTLAFGGASTGITYALQVGRYTRVGRTVSVQAYLQLSAAGSATGAMTVEGLPFASANVSNYVCIGVCALDNAATSQDQPIARLNSNSTSILVMGGTATDNWFQWTDSGILSANLRVFVSLTYTV